LDKARELARALAEVWNEEIPPGSPVVIRRPGRRVHGITLGVAWENFSVPVVQVCCDSGDFRILPLASLIPGPGPALKNP